MLTIINTYDVLMNHEDSAVIVNFKDLPKMPDVDVLNINYPDEGGINIDLGSKKSILIGKSDEGDIERFLEAKGTFLLVAAEPDQDEPIDLWLCKKEGSRCSCRSPIYRELDFWRCERCFATIPDEFSGRKVTESEAFSLLNGESVSMSGLVSKAGNSFDAVVFVADGKVKFKFA